MFSDKDCKRYINFYPDKKDDPSITSNKEFYFNCEKFISPFYSLFLYFKKH